jgi:lipopolysaccharide biosynthesis glycosyltransferase
MRSTCVTTRRRADLVFHLVHEGLAPGHKADLDRIATEFGCSVRHYPLDDTDVLRAHLPQLPESGTPRWTPIVYARLFIHHILPEDVPRIVYLDADVYVRRPIEQLYDIDLEGFSFAAAEAAYHVEAQINRDFSPKLGLFDPADTYFNSGVLVIDMARWAAIDIVAEFAAILGPRIADRATMDAIMLDQDVLNLVFRNRWKMLDFRWNFQNPVPPHEQLFPFIVHYCGTQKPWFLLSKLAFARHYRHLMSDELFYRYMRFRWRRDFKRWLAKKLGRLGPRGRA